MLNKLSPFFAIIFSFIILREKMNIWQSLAVVIAFVGALFYNKADRREFLILQVWQE